MWLLLLYFHVNTPLLPCYYAVRIVFKEYKAKLNIESHLEKKILNMLQISTFPDNLLFFFCSFCSMLSNIVWYRWKLPQCTTPSKQSQHTFGKRTITLKDILGSSTTSNNSRKEQTKQRIAYKNVHYSIISLKNNSWDTLNITDCWCATACLRVGIFFLWKNKKKASNRLSCRLDLDHEL